jgi:halimadienyl-diphosphate synthase
MNAQINKLLTEIGIGRISPSAYDTAWIARLQSQMPEQSSAALDWLRANQLPDGSWGASEFFHYHDRMACTLSAVNAFQQAGAHDDKNRIHSGLEFLVKNSKKMDLNPVGATVGFEMIAPTLLEDVKTNGYGNCLSLNGNGAAARQRKLKNIPSHMISRHTTMAHSAEMVGDDGKHIIDWDDLLEENGSVGFSPAATSYFVMSQGEGTQEAVKHLTDIFQDGNLPTVSSIDLFETTWSLWNFQVAYPSLDPSIISSHLDFIESCWTEVGTSFASGYTPKDGDDSSMAYDVLVRGGRNPDLSGVLHYEDVSVFRCYANESDPSISTNVHVLGALQQAGLECDDSSVQKTLKYLKEKQHPDGWWLDKWHTSPYYPTAHFIIAGAGYCANDMVSKAVSWIANTQNKNGSWGYIIPTAEETAYSLQALAYYKRLGYPVDTNILKRGKSWLLDHQEEIYTSLWVGKSLYSPVKVLASTVLSALVMVDDC